MQTKCTKNIVKYCNKTKRTHASEIETLIVFFSF